MTWLFNKRLCMLSSGCCCSSRVLLPLLIFKRACINTQYVLMEFFMLFGRKLQWVSQGGRGEKMGSVTMMNAYNIKTLRKSKKSPEISLKYHCGNLIRLEILGQSELQRNWPCLALQANDWFYVNHHFCSGNQHMYGLERIYCVTIEEKWGSN